MHRPTVRFFSALCGILFFLALGAAPLAAQEASVTDVRASQRAGTNLVDIHYNLSGPAEGVTISVSLSDDGGETYILPAISLTGAVGHGVLPGANRHIVWDAGTDLPNYFGSNLRFRVSAAVGFSLIPAGAYARGDHKDESESWMEFARPVHDVYISAFYMARTPVTYAEWKDVYDWALANGYTFDNAGHRGSDSSGNALPDTPEYNEHPVTRVSWYDVVKWCNARSEREGRTPVYYTNDARTAVYRQGRHEVTIAQVDWSANGYRLPTEAEWEKAARGGLVGARWPWGDAEIDGTRANYWNSGGTNGTTPVGSYAANGYELYDMAGNVWEWNWDWYSGTWYSQAGASEADTRGPVSGSFRVRRGGSWISDPGFCRVAIRLRNWPVDQWFNDGFRLARTQ